MRYLLDTNVCAMYLNGRSMWVRDRLNSISPEEMAVCSIVKAELFYGAMRSNIQRERWKDSRNFWVGLSRFLLAMKWRSAGVKFERVLPVQERRSVHMICKLLRSL